MKKLNYLLGYSNLKIYQDSEWFKFSLDSVLLSNFIQFTKSTKEILDIGTGNAVIPIILSTKTEASLTGVEIQEDVYHLGQMSIVENNLQNRIHLVCQDIKKFCKIKESDVYDIITCNPPYFKATENSHINEDIHKQYARHELLLNLDDVMQISKKLLKNNGSLYMVHRPERLLDILEKARNYNLELKRLQFVYPKKGKESNILLMQFTKNGKPGLKVVDPLYIYDVEGNYTEEMKYFFS